MNRAAVELPATVFNGDRHDRSGAPTGPEIEAMRNADVISQQCPSHLESSGGAALGGRGVKRAHA